MSGEADLEKNNKYYHRKGGIKMVKTAHSGADYHPTLMYVVNRGTKGHRTLHRVNNPSCFYSKGPFYQYEEFGTVDEAMNSDPVPQKCKICFSSQP